MPKLKTLMSTLQQWVGILCHFNNNFFLFFQVTPNAPILCWIYETAVALGTKIASKLPCNEYNIFNTYFDLTLNFTYVIHIPIYGLLPKS